MALAGASLAVTKANERASADASYSDPERDEAYAEAAEADRRRRDAADELTKHSSVAAAVDEHGDG
jgi:hypothetical protein